MSDDRFEQLRSDAYDLGTVCEDCELEGEDQYGLELPPYDQVGAGFSFSFKVYMYVCPYSLPH